MQGVSHLLPPFGLVFCLMGCVATEGFGVSGTGSHRAPSTGGSPGAGASSGGHAAGSTSGSMTTSGTSGGLAPTGPQSDILPDGGCPAVGYRFAPSDCAAGLVEEMWNLVEFPGQTPVANTTVTDITDPSRTAISDACGYFYFCVDAGTRFAMSLSQPGLASELSPYIQPGANSLNISAPGFITLSSTTAMQLSSLFQNYNASLSYIFTNVIDNEPDPDAGICADLTGWTFALTTLDGGTVDAGLIYLAGLGPSQTPSTTNAGIAMFYNVDPSLQTVVVNATPPARLLLPDGGAACVPIDWSFPFNMVGPALPLQASFGSVAPFIVAPPLGG